MNQDSSLLDGYRGVVCDLDGVIYRGRLPIAHAVDVLNAVASAGTGVVFATNNASRTPAEVAAQLRGLGLTLADTSVVTSAQAGARELAGRLSAGSAVLAVGGEGVAEALHEVGLRPVRAGAVRAAAGAGAVRAAAGAGAVWAAAGAGGAGAGGSAGTDGPGAAVAGVLQGYGPEVCWEDLAEAAYAVQAGAVWVATNDDATLPTERGMAPGNGTLVAAVRAATGVDPLVTGKPWTPLYDLSMDVLHTERGAILAVGDRLDTDILGANRAGMDAVLVLTGVHGVRDVALAAPGSRPRYLARDLRALRAPYRPPTAVDGGWRCGDAVARFGGGEDVVLQQGEEPVELLRALVAAAWEALDAGRSTPEEVSRACQEVSRLMGEAAAGGGQ